MTVLPLGTCCGQPFWTWAGWALHRALHRRTTHRLVGKVKP